ncbi:unnamed protein product, partial [Ectocarpus sp. 8 AP-2014]
MKPQLMAVLAVLLSVVSVTGHADSRSFQPRDGGLAGAVPSDREESLLTSWSLMGDGRGEMPSARRGSAAEATAVVHGVMNDGLEGEKKWSTVPAEAGGRRGEEDEEKTADVVVQEQGVVSRDEDGLASIRRLAINFT